MVETCVNKSLYMKPTVWLTTKASGQMAMHRSLSGLDRSLRSMSLAQPRLQDTTLRICHTEHGVASALRAENSTIHTSGCQRSADRFHYSSLIIASSAMGSMRTAEQYVLGVCILTGPSSSHHATPRVQTLTPSIVCARFCRHAVWKGWHICVTRRRR